MEKKELLDYCLEKNILLDNSLLNSLIQIEDLSSVKILLDKIKYFTKKSFINKNLIENNKYTIKKFLDEISINRNINFDSIINEFNLEDLEKENIKIVKNKFEEKDNFAKVVFSNPTIPKSLEVKDFINYFKNRYEDMKNFMQERQEFENLVSINKIPFDKQKFSVIGMVVNKKNTKNGNVILEIEDLTGKIKVLISANKEELLKESEDITLDSVIGFKGLGNKEILFANEIYFPESRLEKRKKGLVDEYALFIGDLHFGSRNFLEKDFSKFIDYLSEENKDIESRKIKYLFLVGDIITGVGNYPNQEKDLVISDLEEQFIGLSGYLKKIRSDIKIIITPGNHDCVRIMEPQPVLDDKYAWPLYEIENVIIAENPSTINIGENGDFSGFNVLLYHGFSYPYYANNIPKLMKENTMNDPVRIMKYMLKNRHLAPTHGSTQYFPTEKDPLLIREIPDIFVSGHTHKSGIVYYNNVLVVSVSSWEGMTPYQEKFGNEPDHCKVPMFNLKTRQVKILDFELSDEEQKGIKRFKEKKTNLKIGIDIDDTIWKFHKKFFEYYNEKNGTNYSHKDYFEYSMEKFFGIDQKKVQELLDDFYSSKYAQDFELMNGVKEIILKLNEKHKIYFITAKHEGLNDFTSQKLKEIFGVDFPIFFVYDKNKDLIKKKADYCMDKGIDILIEDKLTNLEKCVEKGIKGILMNQTWNQKEELHEKIKRVYNWGEIMEKIEEIENEL